MATKFNTQHLLVIDLEASCWKGNAPSGQFNEIIEIGICKVDYKTKEVLEKESIIVKNKKSEISYFCTELTTLTQEYIDEHGVDFSEACEILKKKYKSKNTIWFSWGQYDKNQFKKNCELYNVENPFNNDLHYNIKRLFAIKHGLKNELGVSNGLEHLGMKFDGTPHRGDDDSMNISKLLKNVFNP